MAAPTIDELEKAGGVCERVATNFRVCTSKDGKEYWCTDDGSCIEAPSLAADALAAALATVGSATTGEGVTDMATEAMTGDQLERALAADELGDSDGASFVALVRESDKGGHVAVSVGGCDSWMDIPTSSIESARKEQPAQCQGHTHLRMRITLKKSSDPTAQVLSGLLSQTRPGPPQASDSALHHHDSGMATPVPASTVGTPLMAQRATAAGQVWPETRATFAAQGLPLIKIDCKIDCGVCRDCFPWGCHDYPCCSVSDCRIVIGRLHYAPAL